MGEENPFYGLPSLYIGDQSINPKPLDASELRVDSAKEGGDRTSANVWHHGKLEYSISFSLNDKNNEIDRWYQRTLRRFKVQRKALFWALTHGYTLRIPNETDNGECAYVELTRPSQLRSILRLCIYQFRIYDRFMCPCDIRRGRVRPKRVWPWTKDIIEAYTKQLMKYNIEKNAN